jgi:hypothetical protein
VISIIGGLALIYWGFLVKDFTPADPLKHPSFNVLNLLVPLASPLTSIAVLGTGSDFLNAYTSAQKGYLLALSAGMLVIFVCLIKDLKEDDEQRWNYKVITLFLYAFSVAAFTFLYSRGSAIDFSTRHFKLSSFLLYPLMIDWLLRRKYRKVALGLCGVLILCALVNHIRLVRIWLSDTAVTSSGFRLSSRDMPLAQKERLDSVVKEKTVVVSRFEGRYAIDNQLILPVTRRDGDPTAIEAPGYPVLYLDPSGRLSKP